MKKITGIIKWHYYTNSYVFNCENQDKTIKIIDLLKEFNNKKVHIIIQES